ncbi:MAG: MBL fold metallo-hydrolase [Deltaproteobacteria bacterium]|nr:MBL fold metallo-hydrolase [Myxococcales bacterium]MDP3212702.1 MBL fold metallo-hydrolase [Deltaproteobacteria bacterium]
MKIQEFYDPKTFTLTFVAYDEATHDAVVIDPVLDYEPGPSQTSTASVDAVSRFIEREALTLRYVLETHAHADHLSGSQLLKQRHGARVAIGARITEVQETFRGIFDLGPEFRADGSQFDRLLADGETLQAGSLAVRVIATPGHTPACVSYLIDDALFTGDALFIEDYGTGRCDFPRGSADDLYDSVQRLYALPDATRVFVGHDYQPGERPLRFETTIGASKRGNVQLRADTPKADYVAFRRGRDATLAAPRLLLPSVQVNVNAGVLPKPSANGVRYLNLPINLFHPTDEVGNPKPA